MFKEVRENQIEDWKKEHKEVLVLSFKNGGKVYLIDPNVSKNYFHLAKRAMAFQNQADVIGAGEVVFRECYLGGLGDLQTFDKNNPVYVHICMYCTQLLEPLEAVFTKA